MKTMLFFDVDGTLFDNKNLKVWESTTKAIKALAQNKDYILGLATGRSYSQLNAITELLPYFSYKVLINGATAYHNEEFLFGKSMNKEDTEQIFKYAQTRGFGVAYIGAKEFAISDLTDASTASLRDYDLRIPKIDPFYHHYNDIYQMWVFCPRKEYLTFKEKFSQLTVYPWTTDGVDLTSKEVNKGVAILNIRQLEQVDKLISFGDGANDLEMLQGSDISVCMGNSQYDFLKKAATYVTARIDEDGLSKAIYHLGLLK